jgi:hypothetical protein
MKIKDFLFGVIVKAFFLACVICLLWFVQDITRSYKADRKFKKGMKELELTESHARSVHLDTVKIDTLK